MVVTEDEEYKRVNPARFATLPTAFQKENGTLTAGNSSVLSDGAAACVLSTAQAANRLGAKPLARIVSFSDAATYPIDFPIAPGFGVPIALQKAGVRYAFLCCHQFLFNWSINQLDIELKFLPSIFPLVLKYFTLLSDFWKCSVQSPIHFQHSIFSFSVVKTW